MPKTLFFSISLLCSFCEQMSGTDRYQNVSWVVYSLSDGISNPDITGTYKPQKLAQLKALTRPCSLTITSVSILLLISKCFAALNIVAFGFSLDPTDINEIGASNKQLSVSPIILSFDILRPSHGVWKGEEIFNRFFSSAGLSITSTSDFRIGSRWLLAWLHSVELSLCYHSMASFWWQLKQKCLKLISFSLEMILCGEFFLYEPCW